jgi:ubiquinone/menaquinone biosynthesis C-methylase UbiE
MVELMGVAAGAHLLDVGSGTGDDVRALADVAGPSGRAVGVDVSEAMIAAARARGGPGEFVVGDAQDLPFPEGTFDACRSERLLAHVADSARAVGEMFRVVRPGGRVVSMEADFETFVVDAPERALTRRILNAWCDEIRNGWIGRSLYASFRAHSGAATQVFPITLVLTSFDEANRFWTLEAHCDRMVRSGRLETAEAVRWIESLRQADRDGRFFCAVTGFVVVGQKPPAT